MPAPKLMPIVNVTPDSFSDGGVVDDAYLAEVERWLGFDNVAVIDVGAESTRPDAPYVNPLTEWNRLERPLQRLVAARDALKMSAEISVDTRHVEVAEKAIALGVDWINDVSGLQCVDMQALIARSGVKAVFMHSVSVPADPKKHVAEGLCPVEEVMVWAVQRLAVLKDAGIAREQLVFDPGIGFGKTAAQSWELLRRVQEFTALQVPLLVGHSRKSFLNSITDKQSHERDLETVLVSGHLLAQPVDYLRVHNVPYHVQALAVARELQK